VNRLKQLFIVCYLKKAFGAHEWFIRLAVGYTAEPNLFSEVVSTALWPPSLAVLTISEDSWQTLSDITMDTK
jgi:hypothetical protein